MEKRLLSKFLNIRGRGDSKYLPDAPKTLDGVTEALGRRFESCRPESNNPFIDRFSSLSFLLDNCLILKKGGSRGS